MPGSPVMKLYERFVLPRVVHCVCGSTPFRTQRRKVVPGATGRVLEIGFGSGLNLPYYDSTRVEGLFALEPDPSMWKLAKPTVRRSPFPVEPLLAGAEAIPLPDDSVDTVVSTYTLCTIPEVERALREIRRVLRPAGRFRFCEHGRAPDPGPARWQDRVQPVWRRFSGGCQLTRDVAEMLSEAGFDTTGFESRYLPGWRPATYNTWGATQASGS